MLIQKETFGTALPKSHQYLS